MPQHTLRACFDDTTVRVYQAFRPEIARPALEAGRFVPPFKRDRMTWIKPSFNWMMYRCGYAQKPGQEYVLGVDITREGLEWALAHAALSTFTPSVHPSQDAWRHALQASPVRVQWDPERDWRLQPLPHVRSIQIGLSGEAVARYVDSWIVRIEDVTPLARDAAHAAATHAPMPPHLPCAHERPYPLPDHLAAICQSDHAG